MMYAPISQTRPSITNEMTIVLSTTTDPLGAARTVRSLVHRIDPDVPLYDVRSMEEVHADTVKGQRFSMFLIGLFAVVAGILAVVGIYGVISFIVGQRVPELGLRMALGAQRGRIARMVLFKGLSLTVAGVTLGLAGAIALTRLLTGMLYGITPTDPLTYGGMTALLFAAAALACYVPARRASRVDPMVLMRAE